MALLQGARESESNLTSIDVYTGFHDGRIKTERSDQCMHWEHLEWQNNVSNYSDLVTSYHGCAVPILKDLLRKQKKYDLIFLDTAHDLESIAEFTLISCVASEKCLFILDDVVDFNNDMTSAWLLALKYYFAFPRFHSSYAMARLKHTSMPMNFKANPSDVFGNISAIASYIEKKISEGCKFTVHKRA